MVSTLLCAGAFSVLTGPVKQVAWLYGHAPWLNDPYDTVISFMMFFVPLLAACCLVRVTLCRKVEPLPVARVRDLLRGCQVVLGAIVLTLASEWISVALGANRTQWSAPTWVQIGILALLSLLSLGALVELHRAPLRDVSSPQPAGEGDDWLSDMVVIAQRESRRLGPLHRPVLGALSWLDGRLVTPVRHHPLWAALVGCAAFGLGAGVNQGIREGYGSASTILVSVLLSTGMFGLLVGAGSYLGLIRTDVQLKGFRRRLVDALVISCVGVLVPFALRYHLWWIVGTDNAHGGLGQLVALLALFATLIFGLSLGAESLFHSHADTVTR